MRSATPLLHHLPLFLTLLRAALAPVMILLAYYLPSSIGFASCLIVALVSDIYDGKIARRLGVATANLRRLDSIADSIFYVAATYCVWHLHKEIITDNAVPLILLLALEMARYFFDLAKFKREASYHMWSSKLWGLFLFAGFFSALVFGESGYPVCLAIYWGLVADIEGLLISMILPVWKNDVPSFVHALKLRKSLQTSE
ncbi:CDP-alcohol phosphatidyltransferase family protein [Herbaspirillum lusitanum]|uniref:CDP-alcohol phosphatidyltransferase family protein n=1 Tax=Herbaspirillum lusitanum TaxID=213312 RepID=A0ABW9AF20_9BURK